MKDKINIAELYRNWRKFSNKNKPSFLKEYTVSQFTFGFELEGFISKSGKGAKYYDENGYDDEGYDREGHDYEGYNRDGRDDSGIDRYGYDEDGYDYEGYDEEGFDENGLDEDGYDRGGFDENGYDIEGFDDRGVNREGNDRTQGPANFHSRNPNQKELPFPLKEAENRPKKYSHPEELKDEIVDYFEDIGDVTYTTLKSDGSLRPDYPDDRIFEIAGPVLPLTPYALGKTIKFLQDLDMRGVYTNDTCGFHTHISWPNISALEVFWVICNISNDPESFELATEFNDGEIDFTHERYANVGRLKTLRKIFNGGGRGWSSGGEDPHTKILNSISEYLDGDKFNVFRIHQGAGTVEWRGPRKFLTDFDLIPEFFKTVWKLGLKLNQFLESNTIINTDITRKEFNDHLELDSSRNFDNKNSKFKHINRKDPSVSQWAYGDHYTISTTKANLENEIKLGISKKLEGFNKQTLDKIKHFVDEDAYIYVLNNSKGVPVAKSMVKFQPTQDPKVLINYYTEPQISSDGKRLTRYITGASLISSEGKKLSEKFYDIRAINSGEKLRVEKQFPSDQGGTTTRVNFMDLKGNILLDHWFTTMGQESTGWTKVELEDGTENFINDKHQFMTTMTLPAVDRFWGGMALISNQNGEYSLINNKGTLLCPWNKDIKSVEDSLNKFQKVEYRDQVFSFNPEIYGTIRDIGTSPEETPEETTKEPIKESLKFRIKFKLF